MTIQEMRDKRKELGYSYARLSELSGVPETTIQKIFSGTTASPRYATLQALEKALGPSGNLYIHENTAPYQTEIIRPPYARQGSYTIYDRERIPEEFRTELIEGVLYDMASPSISHQRIAGRIYYQIANYIAEKGGSCEPFIAPLDVQLNRDEKTIVQPDIIIVCNPDLLNGPHVYGAPDFVLEVISPSTRRKDYTKKLPLYEQAGVREYWIVDAERKTVFVFFFEDSSRCPGIYPMDEKIPVGIYKDELEIDLKELL